MSELAKHNEHWFNTETGEVVTKKELQRLNDLEFIEANNRYYQNALTYDLDKTTKLTKIKDKESTTKTVKENHKFNMIHRTDVKDLMLSGKLSEKECAFIGRFQGFITFPDNDLRIHKEYLSIEELGKILGYSKNVMTKILKSLEENEVIKVVKGGNRPPIIYFNPFLYSAGREVSNDTFYLFCQSKYNPEIEHYI